MKILKDIIDQFSKKSWLFLITYEIIFIACIIAVFINDLVIEKAGILSITIFIIIVCLLGISIVVTCQVKKSKDEKIDKKRKVVRNKKN